jgi:hypothetical protein
LLNKYEDTQGKQGTQQTHGAQQIEGWPFKVSKASISTAQGLLILRIFSDADALGRRGLAVINLPFVLDRRSTL